MITKKPIVRRGSVKKRDLKILLECIDEFKKLPFVKILKPLRPTSEVLFEKIWKFIKVPPPRLDPIKLDEPIIELSDPPVTLIDDPPIELIIDNPCDKPINSQPSMPCLSSIVQNLQNVVPKCIPVNYQNEMSPNNYLDWFKDTSSRPRKHGYSSKKMKSHSITFKDPTKTQLFMSLTRNAAKFRVS